MMEKKAYSYKLTLEGLTDPQGVRIKNERLDFEFQNHDDLFKILEMSKGKALFENSDDNTEFFLGLKLLSEVLLRNRKTSNAMTQELFEAVGVFIKKLKAQ